VPASEVERLRLEHEGQLKALQAQAGRVSDLEIELARLKDAESKLHLDFEQRLAKEREDLSAKYDAEVEELRTEQETKNRECDVELLKVMNAQEEDSAKYHKELGVRQGRDHRIHSSLCELDEALIGKFLLLFPTSFPYVLLLTCYSCRGFPRLLCCRGDCDEGLPEKVQDQTQQGLHH
jgi:hypothetical protein